MRVHAKISQLPTITLCGLVTFTLFACVQNLESDPNYPVDVGLGTADSALPQRDADLDTGSAVIADASSNLDLNDATVFRQPPLYLGGGRPATYALPYGFEPGQELPLMISMHGFGGNAAWHDAYWGLSALTKELGVLLVMPNGRTDLDGRQFWSATNACCNFFSESDTDTDYLRGIIEEAQVYFNIDPARVALVGHSNGGFMSYRAACDHADLVTHVGALAGTMWFDPAQCQPTRPVSIYHLHGTWDTVIRYGGRDLTLTAEINAVQCQRESCAEQLALCRNTPRCETLIQCLNGCGFSPRQQDCRDICVLSAGELARNDWTDLFICTLNAGCYDSSYGYFGPYPGAEETVANWSRYNDCRGSQLLDRIDLDSSLPGQETRVAEFDQCDGDTVVRLGRIERGAHGPSLNTNFSMELLEWFLSTPRRER